MTNELVNQIASRSVCRESGFQISEREMIEKINRYRVCPGQSGFLFEDSRRVNLWRSLTAVSSGVLEKSP